MTVTGAAAIGPQPPPDRCVVVSDAGPMIRSEPDRVLRGELEKLAIQEARSLLANSSLSEGKRLWTELRTHAKNTRLGSGTLDISDLSVHR